MQSKEEVWMNMAYLIASLSKDTSTHIGAVVVGPDNEIRSTGYNSFPRGIDDNVPARQERPEKYFWFAHAERNAIYNAARIGVGLKGCTLYTNGMPCTDCAIGVIQSGITKVVLDADWDKSNNPKWEESGARSVQMFKEAGIEVEYLKFNLLDIYKFKSGEVIDGCPSCK